MHLAGYKLKYQKETRIRQRARMYYMNT